MSRSLSGLKVALAHAGTWRTGNRDCMIKNALQCHGQQAHKYRFSGSISRHVKTDDDETEWHGVLATAGLLPPPAAATEADDDATQAFEEDDGDADDDATMAFDDGEGQAAAMAPPAARRPPGRSTAEAPPPAADADG